jgi:hypothetical protein
LKICSSCKCSSPPSFPSPSTKLKNTVVSSITLLLHTSIYRLKETVQYVYEHASVILTPDGILLPFPLFSDTCCT